MRKWSVGLLGLVLVALFSVGAAAQIGFNGFLEADVVYREKRDNAGEPLGEYELLVRGRRRISLTMNTGRPGKIRAIVSLGATDAGNNDAWLPWTDLNMFSPGADVGLNVIDARIGIDGALWKGGPEVTTVVGRYAVGWSPWVAALETRRVQAIHQDGTDQIARNGIELRGLKLGSVTWAFYTGSSLARGDYGRDQPFIAKVDGLLPQGSWGLVAVNRIPVTKAAIDREKEDRVWDFALTGTSTVAAGISVDGTFAVDGQGDGHIGTGGGLDLSGPGVLPEPRPAYGYRLNATVDRIPAVKLTGSTWTIEERFAPRYARWDPDPEVRNFTAFTPNRAGFRIGAEAVRSGATWTGSYLRERNVSGDAFAKSETTAGVAKTVNQYDLSADYRLTDDSIEGRESEVVLGVGRRISNFDVKYTGTIERKESNPATMKNEISVDTRWNLPLADGVKVNAAVIHDGAKDEDDRWDYGIDMSWQAPNGLQFVVGYATYDKSGEEWVHGKGPDGFYLRSHIRVNF